MNTSIGDYANILLLAIGIVIFTLFATDPEMGFFAKAEISAEQECTEEETGPRWEAPTVAVCSKEETYVSGMRCEEYSSGCTEPEACAAAEPETVAAAENVQSEAENRVLHSEKPNCTISGKAFALSEFLYNTLDAYGIAERWYRIGLCQSFQESGWNVRAVSSDGKDHGLLQFRAAYWEDYAGEAGFSGADIYDPYVQIAVYAYHVADRIRKGWSDEEIISAHYTGGVGFSEQYVNDVMQWMQDIEEK